MTDSVAVWPPGTRFATSGGTILASGTIEFYAAGTTDPMTVYSDADLSNALGPVVYLDAGGAPVAEEDSSTKVAVYVGTSPFKVIIKDSFGNVVETKDWLQGAFDSASILETLVLIPETEVETLTGADTLTSADVGQLKNCNTTGGGFALTLPDATQISNGARLGFRMAGSANAVTIRSTQGQSIARAGITSTAFALSRFGETVWLVNDGGNWIEDTYVPPLHNTVGVIQIADRIATPPDTPAAGARYILTSGPDGAWSSYVEHDIVEADGNGGWFRYTPAEDCGWIAYVADENAYYWFVGAAWVQQTASSTVAGTVKVSTRSIMETGTAEDAAVLVGHQHFHPAHPKAWGYVEVSGGTPTLVESYNVSGITDTGTGILTVTLDADMASDNYCVLGTTERSGTPAEGLIPIIRSKAAGSFQFLAMEGDSAPNLVDPVAYHFAVFGELAE